MKSRCQDFIENVWSIKKKIKELKYAPSANMVSCEDSVLVREDEHDYEVKRYEILNEGRICYVKVNTHQSSILSNVEKKNWKYIINMDS